MYYLRCSTESHVKGNHFLANEISTRKTVDGVALPRASLKSMDRSTRCRRPIFLKLRSSTGFITATVAIAIFTDLFLYGVITPVFPFSLVNRQGVAADDVQHWFSVLLAIYGVGMVVGSPICGFLADRITYRKWPLLFGLLLVAGSTIMLCLAKSLPLLIAGRLMQGFAASVIWVVGFALLSDTVGQDEIATSLGYVGTAMSLGTLLSPLLGGIVYQKAGYYAVYGMCFAVISVDVVLRFSLIEKKAAAQWLDESFDDGDSNTESSRGPTPADPEKHMQPPVVDDPVPPEKKTPTMYILYSSRRLLAATWGTVCMSTLVCGLDTTLTLFVHRTFGWNSLAAGLMFLPILLPELFGPLFGKFVDKYGSRWISAIGFVIGVPPWVLLRYVTHNSLQQKVLLGALLALIGLGLAMTINGCMAEFSKVCDEKERRNPGLFGKHGAYAQSYGLLNVAWAAGSIIGAFWGGGVYNAAGWGTLGWSFALLSGVTAIPVLLFSDGWIGGKKQDYAV